MVLAHVVKHRDQKSTGTSHSRSEPRGLYGCARAPTASLILPASLQPSVVRDQDQGVPSPPSLNTRASTITRCSRLGRLHASDLFPQNTSQDQRGSSALLAKTEVQHGSQIGPLCPVTGQRDIGGVQAMQLKATAFNTPLASVLWKFY